MISILHPFQSRNSVRIGFILVFGLFHLAGCAQKFDTAEDFVELGRRHERAGELPETVTAYQKALELNENLPLTWYDLGVAYAAMERFPEAINAYSKAIDQDPRMARAYTNRAAIYARLLQFDKAIPDCDQAIKYEPDDFIAWRNRGLARHDRGDLADAIEDYDESIRINGKSAETYHYRGNVFLDQKQWNRALEDFDQAIRLNDSLSAAWSSRAIACARLGMMPDAEAARKKAAELGAKVDDVILADLAPRLNSSGIATELNQKAISFLLAELNRGEKKVEPADAPWDLRSLSKQTTQGYIVRILSMDGKESGVRFTTSELTDIQKSDIPTTLVIIKQLSSTQSEPNQPAFKIVRTFENWKPDLTGMQPLTWSMPLPLETAAVKTDAARSSTP